MKTKIQTYRKGFIGGMILVVLLAIVLTVSFQSCQREDELAGQDGSYLKSTAIVNPTLYWGQEKFVFYKGKPVTETRIIGSSDLEYFENNFVINIQNGDGTNNKVSSAIIKIDGVQIVGPIDFKKETFDDNKGNILPEFIIKN